LELRGEVMSGRDISRGDREEGKKEAESRAQKMEGGGKEG